MNAKELILAKINAGTNFAKMYVFLMYMGYDLQDMAAFMFSPIAEFIDSRSNANMFQDTGVNNNAQTAINLALGIVPSKQFLHGSISEYDMEAEESITTPKIKYVELMLNNLVNYDGNLKKAVYGALGINPDSMNNLRIDVLMQGLILSGASAINDLDLTTLTGKQSDMEINNYLRFCQDLITQLRVVNSQYKGKFNELYADAREFKKIYELSTEMSTVASAYLGLNQGLPTDKLSILKRLNSMRKVISDRERIMGINEGELFNSDTSTEGSIRREAAWNNVINAIQENNSALTETEIREALTKAHEIGIMGKFDVVKMLMDEEYKQVAKDYLHVIKGTVNAIDLVDTIPHYREIMNCLRTLLLADMSLAQKSRLIAKLTTDGKTPSDKQLKGIIKYVDKLNIVNFLDECPIVIPHKATAGFNAYFDSVTVNRFDLSTQEGVAGFKNFMETEFLAFLNKEYLNNSLVGHIRKVLTDGRISLATDIDLLNPEVTTASRLSYDDILRGMAEFELVKYNDDYTITDMFQLYNLIVNNNQYGGERLTTTFKACSNPNSVLQTYLKYIGEVDYDFETSADYEQIDYLINAAPTVYPASERYHYEPFIKVVDPVWDYTIKQYNKTTNSYKEYPLLPSIYSQAVDEKQKDARRINLTENLPFEMPMRYKAAAISDIITFDGDATPEIVAQVKDVLSDLSLSGKILIMKLC